MNGGILAAFCNHIAFGQTQIAYGIANTEIF